jgi:signal transduction histidine kinase
MSIRNKLILLMSLLVAIAASNITILQIAKRDLEIQTQESQTANELIVSLASLRYLTLEYLLRPSDRTQTQWGQKYRSLNQLLELAQRRYSGPEQQLVEGIRENLVQLGQFFEEVAAKPAARPTDGNSSARASEHRDRLTRQMLARIQEMISEGTRLSRNNHDSMAEFVDKRLGLIFAAEIFLVISIGLLILSIFSSVLAPLDLLVGSTRKVAEGDLGVRLPHRVDSEFGLLNDTFNDMLDKLEETLQQLQSANAALLNSNQDLSRFAYVASHDLQTPLRSIAGFIQLLEADYGHQLGPDGKDWLRRAQKSTALLQEIIHDLLAYSSLESKSEPFAAVPLDPLVGSVLMLLDVPIKEAGAKIDVGPLPVVFGDDAQLVQLFQNLIGNALKFRGDASPVIRLWSTRSEETVSVSINDNGIGIPPEYHARIFEMFQRLHKQSKFQGTGIGLAICQRIIQRHGGSIGVESDGSHGTTFTITLPAFKE